MMLSLKPAVFAIILAIGPSWATAGEVRSDQRTASAALGREIAYTIYLPDGYSEPNARFPVIYVLHGFGAGQREWFHGGRLKETLDRLIEAEEIRPVIAVAPAAGKSWYVDSADYGGPGDYETAIVHDLVMAIDRHYPTIADRAHRAIAGISMGGHGALRFAFAHPDRFSAVAALSPGIWKPGGVSWSLSPQFDPPEEREKWFPRTTGETFDLATFNAQSPFALVANVATYEFPPRILIAVGNDDYWSLQDGALEMYLDLRAHGLKPMLRVADGDHSWKFWRPIVDHVLRFLNDGWPNPENG
ncbi:MAG: esterase family protein [Gammaproteobacteria bacterium]|nr:esterase family protein [Gammaproteobacteria bacterium]